MRLPVLPACSEIGRREPNLESISDRIYLSVLSLRQFLPCSDYTRCCKPDAIIVESLGQANAQSICDNLKERVPNRTVPTFS